MVWYPELRSEVPNQKVQIQNSVDDKKVVKNTKFIFCSSLHTPFNIKLIWNIFKTVFIYSIFKFKRCWTPDFVFLVFRGIAAE